MVPQPTMPPQPPPGGEPQRDQRTAELHLPAEGLRAATPFFPISVYINSPRKMVSESSSCSVCIRIHQAPIEDAVQQASQSVALSLCYCVNTKAGHLMPEHHRSEGLFWITSRVAPGGTQALPGRLTHLPPFPPDVSASDLRKAAVHLTLLQANLKAMEVSKHPAEPGQ